MEIFVNECNLEISFDYDGISYGKGIQWSFPYICVYKL